MNEIGTSVMRLHALLYPSSGPWAVLNCNPMNFPVFDIDRQVNSLNKDEGCLFGGLA